MIAVGVIWFASVLYICRFYYALQSGCEYGYPHFAAEGSNFLKIREKVRGEHQVCCHPCYVLFDFPKNIFTATHNTAPHSRLQTVHTYLGVEFQACCSPFADRAVMS